LLKLVSFTHRGQSSWGTLAEGVIADLGTMGYGDTLKTALTHLSIPQIAELSASAPAVSLDQVRLLAPVPDPSKILCVGLNYSDHVAEMDRQRPEYPVIFTRFADTLVAHGESIIAPRRSTALDYEGELAVVIGRGGRHIGIADAHDHVLGYSLFNDASVRDYQRHTHQFTPGKNFVGTGAFGPAIVTPDEITDFDGAAITTRLNGAIVQESTLGHLIFSVAEIISYCSEWTELCAGDVIVTGTPGGVGASRTPPLWMNPGDICEVAITQVGILTNPVTEEAAP
jgi:2-keto-4-pentenoate hydratase/2-oxohepta-3-ene-1,7-dioic acid hydratase in catechol pathway